MKGEVIFSETHQRMVSCFRLRGKTIVNQPPNY